MPIRVIITAGTTADCTKACDLIEGIDAETIIADKGYDTDAVIDVASRRGIEVVIPSKRNRKTKRSHDKSLYTLRHLVENAFLHMKEWRGIAFRFAKNTASYLSAVQIRCWMMWLKVI